MSSQHGDELQKAGQRIRSVRESLGLSQRALAEILGISDGALSRYENGLGAPDIGVLRVLAERFNVDSHWVVTGHGNPYLPEEGERDSTEHIGLLDDDRELMGQLYERLLQLRSLYFPAQPVILGGADEGERLQKIRPFSSFYPVPYVSEPGHYLTRQPDTRHIAGYVMVPKGFVDQLEHIRGCRMPDDAMGRVLPEGSIAVIDTTPIGPAQCNDRVVCAKADDGSVVIRRASYAGGRESRLLLQPEPMRMQDWIRKRSESTSTTTRGPDDLSVLEYPVMVAAEEDPIVGIVVLAWVIFSPEMAQFAW